ncbi:putative iron/manganese superoxide dismutases, C-terminal domain [Lyophyllum shimeji]|uniref:Iron/manganese superoxide dismutases, C-terminal domain n=1 Tax=Lyophyllum shimeji TaxID=47721 RepID=A0A9P3PDI5_LYOSH|nr:putative iron/manganese superoxide dismutases, C-terminal domain [Lyophyllum shimeji]
MSVLGLRWTSSNASRCSSAVRRFKSRCGSRNLHQRIPLPYPIEGGLGDFLPPAALKTVAVDYQEGLLQRLDEEVRGTPEENVGVAQTVLNTAPYRERTLAFNYASLALNNSFFLDQLKPPPAPPRKNHQDEISSHLANTIRAQYGSLVQLKSAFSSAVTGMFTNGWVWFVTDKNGNTGIIPTFGPGTLLIRSRSYMGHSKSLVLGPDFKQYDQTLPQDPLASFTTDPTEDAMGDVEPLGPPPPASPTAKNSPPPGVKPSSPASGVSGKKTPSPPENLLPRFLHTSPLARSDFQVNLDNKNALWGGNPEPRTEPRTKTEMMNIGEVLHPLFCISVNEHAWMSAGYGVWGKEEWLKQFWTVLDWEKVSKAYGEFYLENTM